MMGEREGFRGHKLWLSFIGYHNNIIPQTQKKRKKTSVSTKVPLWCMLLPLDKSIKKLATNLDYNMGPPQSHSAIVLYIYTYIYIF